MTTNPKDPQAELRKQLEQIMMLAKIGYDTGSNWQYDTIQSIEALFQAHQQELLTELLGERQDRIIKDRPKTFIGRIIDRKVAKYYPTPTCSEMYEADFKQLGLGEG